MEKINEKILRTPQKINWTDLFSSFNIKHTQSDRDYALIAGSSLDTATSESTMLQKWQCPWLWQKVLIAGLLLAAVIVGIILYIVATEGRCRYNALNLLFVVIVPCVIPLSLMTFFWELNIPRNISLVQLIKYFLIGGILSLFFTGLLHQFIAIKTVVLAPVTEEPAKLIVSLYFLYHLKKHGKVYGLNGIVIGAAVGAGFAAFESAQYVYNFMFPIKVNGTVVNTMIMNSRGFGNAIIMSLLRSFCAISSHILFCAPYVGMAALNMENNSTLSGVLTKKNFLIAFLVSCAVHAFNNSGLFVSKHPSFLEFAGGALITIGICTLILWWSCLQTVRCSFEQISGKVPIQNSNNVVMHTTNFKIQCINGTHVGLAFAIVHKDILIGTDAKCNLTFPLNTYGVDSKHCKLITQNGGLYLADLGSKYGTYLNGTKLKVGTGYLLRHRDIFWVGTEQQKFVVL